MITSKHILDYCRLCECAMVRCATCNNNCCNSTYGPNAAGIEMACPDCPDAYDMQDLYWKDNTSVEFLGIKITYE